MIEQTEHAYNIAEVGTATVLSFYLLWQAYRLVKPKKNAFLCKYSRLRKMKKLAWEEFERLCAAMFEKEGWRIVRSGKQGADGGIDIVMRKIGKTALVQCKRYRDAPVGVKTVREMYGLLHEHGADTAYVVTSSTFTKESVEFAEHKPIVLIDAHALSRRLKRYCR